MSKEKNFVRRISPRHWLVEISRLPHALPFDVGAELRTAEGYVFRVVQSPRHSEGEQGEKRHLRAYEETDNPSYTRITLVRDESKKEQPDLGSSSYDNDVMHSRRFNIPYDEIEKLLRETVYLDYDPQSAWADLKASAEEIRRIRSGSGSSAPILPEHAPALWQVDRRNGQSATEFLAEHWGKWSGVLDQRALRKRDPALMQKLENDYRGRRAELRALLPTKSDESTKLLADAGLSPANPRERQRLVTAIRQAKRKI